MNKTLIALAIAAALPVAAQAEVEAVAAQVEADASQVDVSFSGTLTTKYKTNTGAIDTDARLQLNASEVWANGITATATFAVLADTDDDTENSGTASLSGGFGALTAGSIDADGAFQAGDIAGVVADTVESTSSTASTIYGIHYAAGDLAGVAGLSVAAQVNANTDAAGVGVIDAVEPDKEKYIVAADAVPAPTKSHQIGVSYEVTDDLKVGFSTASRAATNASKVASDAVDAVDAIGDAEAIEAIPAYDGHDGIHEKQTAFGAAYTFGDLVVSVGKSSIADALISVTYTLAAGPLEVKTQVNNDDSDYQIDISYAVTDSLTLASEIDKGNDTSLVATYTYGDMTAIVAKTDDGTIDASVALDYDEKATLTLGRVGERAGNDFTATVKRADAAAYTHVTYKVAF